MPGKNQWSSEKLGQNSCHYQELILQGLVGSSKLTIPFFALVGKSRKPRALIIAGVHGDEYEGVAVLQDVAKEINPSHLTGTLTIVPVANPQAFYAGTRRNPVDLGDLNRSFPGDPKGTMSERVAHLLFTEVVLGNDSVLSLHGWSHTATSFPYVEYPDENTALGRKSFRAAMALGLRFAHPYKWHPGLLGSAAMRAGIAAIEPEVGGMGTMTDAGQQAYRQVIYAYLRHLKMLPPKQRPQAKSPPKPAIVDHSDLLANCAGLFRSYVEVGQKVKSGALLGTLHDLSGSRLEELHAPRAGTVVILRTFSSVQPGNLLIQLFWNKN